MSFYSETANTANEALEEYGQIVTLTHVVPGVYDPATGLMTNTATTQKGTGVVIDWDARQVDGSLIQIGDKKLLLSPLNTAGAVLTAPVLGDTVTDAASVVYTLVAPLSTLSPAGTAVIYDCNMRV